MVYLMVQRMALLMQTLKQKVIQHQQHSAPLGCC
jgi:hypothetical protein